MVVLARSAANELVCLGEVGRVEWRFAGGDATLFVGTPARVREHAPAAQVAEDRLYVATAEKSPRLIRLAAHGQTLWSRPLPKPAQGVPVVLSENATQKLTSLYILVILAVMWNVLAGYGGAVARAG